MLNMGQFQFQPKQSGESISFLVLRKGINYFKQNKLQITTKNEF